MVDIKTGRVVSQEDWKRTQVRMPQEVYDSIVEYAEDRKLSLNSAMLELIEGGLNPTLSGIANDPDEHLKSAYLKLMEEHKELLKETLHYQDDLIKSKEEILRLYKLFHQHNINY